MTIRISSILFSIIRWLVPSAFVGALAAALTIMVIHLCFPVQSLEWGVSFLPIWLGLSIVVGIPPHHKTPLIDEDFSGLGNAIIFIICEAIVSVFMVLLALLVSYFADKGAFDFILANLLIVYLGTVLYSSILRLSDHLWQWLRSL